MPQQQTVISLLKGDAHQDTTDYRDSLSVNMSAIIRPMMGAAGYLLEQPGLTQYATGVGVDRGGLWNERLIDHYRVSGGQFISVSNTGVVVELGAIPGSGTVSLPYSFNTQGIIADGRFYLYNADDGLKEVTDPDLGVVIDGVWIDGYYFMTDGEFLFHTDLDDEFSINPLKFATAEFSPDPTVGVGVTVDSKAIAFNRYTTEYFVNSANVLFAWQRVPSRQLLVGTVGTHSKCTMLDKWYIMGGRKEEDIGIHMLGVGTATKISSREIDKILAQFTEDELRPTVMETRVAESVHYIIVHLPGITLLYNHEIAQLSGTELAWSTLRSDISGAMTWRAIHGVFDSNRSQWIYGDKLGPIIGYLDNSVATHYGEIAGWELNTPFIYLETASINQIEIEIVPGFTSTNDAGVFISLTYNGVTYGTETIADYGDAGEYAKRFIKRRFGYVRDWFSLKLRGASRSRMAFSVVKLFYG